VGPKRVPQSIQSRVEARRLRKAERVDGGDLVEKAHLGGAGEQRRALVVLPRPELTDVALPVADSLVEVALGDLGRRRLGVGL